MYKDYYKDYQLVIFAGSVKDARCIELIQSKGVTLRIINPQQQSIIRAPLRALATKKQGGPIKLGNLQTTYHLPIDEELYYGLPYPEMCGFI